MGTSGWKRFTACGLAACALLAPADVQRVDVLLPTAAPIRGVPIGRL